jgi:hypothetical protein
LSSVDARSNFDLMTTNPQPDRERASIDHVVRARQLVNENAAAIGQITSEELAILLGRVVRAVEELSGKVDVFEAALTSIEKKVAEANDTLGGIYMKD